MWFLPILILLEVSTSYCRVIDTAIPPSPKRIACYYANWSYKRDGNLYFTPDYLDAHVCTHLIYAYATVEEDGFLAPFDVNHDLHEGGYQKFVDLKKENPDLKVMLGLGGTKAGVARFSKIAGDPELRKIFAQNAVLFLNQFKFDGLDIAWKYPGFRDGSSANDKENYVKLLKELKVAFRREAAKTKTPVMVLSIIVPKLTVRIDRGFDLEGLSKYTDFMTILSYDYHSPTDLVVHHSSPTYKLPGDEVYEELNIDATVREYTRRGVNLAKFNIAIPLFGLSFQLEEPEETDIGSLAGEEADEVETGYLYYNDLCQRLKKGNWTVKHANKTAVGPYAYRGTQWMSYDDEETIRNKAKYVIDHKLGGVTFWTIDYDDFRGLCHNRKYPLINAAKEEFLKPTEVKAINSEPPTSQEPPKIIETTTAKIIRKPPINSANLLPVDGNKKNEKTKQHDILSADKNDLILDIDVKKDPVHNKNVVEESGSHENLVDHISDQITQETQGYADKGDLYENLNNFIALSMPSSLETNLVDKGEKGLASPEGSESNFPKFKINGHRDIIFQNIRIWVTNNYATPKNST